VFVEIRCQGKPEAKAPRYRDKRFFIQTILLAHNMSKDYKKIYNATVI
jgi:hypothetical protein